MTKKEACHKLADINEKIYELEELLANIDSRLRWDDDKNRDWYMGQRAKLIVELEKNKQEHIAFINKYRCIIYS